MSGTEQVLLVCMPADGGPVIASDATVDLDSGRLAAIHHPGIRQAVAAACFIRLKGHPGRFTVDRLPPFDTPQFRLNDAQLAQVRAALQNRGCHPCAYARTELPQ